MPMQVDVECAELFVEDVHTFLFMYVAVTSNDSQPSGVRATMNVYAHVSPALQ